MPIHRVKRHLLLALASATSAAAEQQLFTPAELATYDGRDAGKPLLIAFNHTVFDVSTGAEFYGPDTTYHSMAGHEIARAVAEYKLEPKLYHADLTGISDQQLSSMLQIYNETYIKKYPIVGRVSAKECSYNGVCSSGSGSGSGDGSDGGTGCKCNPGWVGARCGVLDLRPVDRTKLGYRAVHVDSKAKTRTNVSSWGAPVLFDDKSKKWHGWASEMLEGCGINAWETNSQVVHIVSDSPLGPFERKEVVWPAFAHEPDVVRGPQGEWVMLFSAFPYNTSGLDAHVCRNCSNGATPAPKTPGCPFQRGEPAALRHPFRQMMAIAPSPEGPWDKRLVEIPQLTTAWDWNTALTINADGSAVALIRGGMVWHASNYSEPSSWHAVGGEPEGPQWKCNGRGVEDPYVYRGPDGVFHALAHAFSPFFGVHAFSDAPLTRNWTDGTPMEWTITSAAYGNNVSFTDGSSFAFSRRERPHLVWARGTAPGEQPVALTNGVQYGGPPNAPGGDAVYTLAQPIGGGAGAGP
eukprot:g1890.t1